VRLGDMEQLGNHCGNAVKMSGPRQTAEMPGEVGDLNPRLRTVRIHFLNRRQKHHIHTHVPGLLKIAFRISWVLFKVLAGAELGGVDENADYQRIGMSSAHPHQFQMTFVQKSHGRDQSDCTSGRPQGIGSCLHFLNRFYNIHGKTPENAMSSQCAAKLDLISVHSAFVNSKIGRQRQELIHGKGFRPSLRIDATVCNAV